MEFLDSTYLDEFITVLVLQVIAVASPGPDFAIVIQNSLLYSRKVGLYTAVGIAVGILVHVALASLGVGMILTQSFLLFTLFKIFACSYLLYMAYRSLRAGKEINLQHKAKSVDRVLPLGVAFKSGVITNVMNPKCILFMLTLFTVVVSPATPRMILLCYGGVIFMITLFWFLSLAFFFSHPKVQQIFSRFTRWVSRFTSLVFILIALKIIFDLVGEFL